MINRTRTIAALVALCVVSAFAASAASARPPSTYRNWARTPGNAAGVVFHPYGDFWEVWYNRGGDTPSAVNVEFNYKGIDDRWKTAVQQIVVGQTPSPSGRRSRSTARRRRRVISGPGRVGSGAWPPAGVLAATGTKGRSP
jgi:hypothetical protein